LRIGPGSSTFPVSRNSLLRQLFAQPVRKLPHVVRQFFQNKANNGRFSTLTLPSQLLLLRCGNNPQTKGTPPLSMIDGQVKKHHRRFRTRTEVAAVTIGLAVLSITLTFAAYSFYPLFQDDSSIVSDSTSASESSLVSDILNNPPVPEKLVAAQLVFPYSVHPGAFATAENSWKRLGANLSLPPTMRHFPLPTLARFACRTTSSPTFPTVLAITFIGRKGRSPCIKAKFF
jgi:hypothetical protein